MPRQARLDLAGQLYHVMGRGIERRDLFREEEDCTDFLRRLAKVKATTDHKILAWSLQPNHFHLLILRGSRPLSELTRRVMTGYAGGFNARHKRVGHVFQNRYKAILCDADEYMLELTAYIHLNPLRAKLVRDIDGLKKYKWSGHGTLTGTKADDILDREYILGYFGENETKAIKRYEEYIAGHAKRKKGWNFSGGGLVRSMGGRSTAMSMVRRGEKEMFDARILGPGNFVEEILKQSGEAEVVKKIEREEILKIIGIRLAVSEKEIKSGSHERRIVTGRAAYCYLMKEKAGIYGARLAEELGIVPSAISYLTKKGREATHDFEL